MSLRRTGFLLLVFLLLATSAAAGAFTQGNIVVARVGDGSAALTANATAVFMEEYTTTAGPVVQSLALPTAVAASNKPLTFSGTATSEGLITRSTDGRYVVLVGYALTPGTTSPLTGTNNRVIGRINELGNIDTSTTVTDAGTSNIRSAGSDDGSRFWFTTGGVGLRFTGFGSTTTSTQILASPSNVRAVSIYGSQLHASSGSGTFVNVFTVGSGVPTTTGQVATSLPGMPTAAGPSPYAFVLFNRDASVAGIDSLHVADDRSISSGGGIPATAGDAHVALSWNAATDATSYAVKRGTVSGGPYTTIAPSVAATSYDDTTAANGTTYYCVVSATGARGTSADSSQVTGTPTALAALGGVVISQVYGGGGASSGSPAYTNDYVELFNRGTSAVDLSGYSIQYGSSAGNFGSSSSNIYAFPAATTIAAGKYLSVKLGSAGTLGATLTCDLTTSNLSMAAASGKVALANITATLGCGATATPCTLPDTRIVDLVSYGASNNGEGATTVNNGTALDSTKGAIRNSNGCTDTNNNNADFTVATPASGLVPRTVASPANTCGGNNPPTITPPATPITSAIQDAAPFTVSLTGSDDGGVYSWSATPGTGISSVTVTGGQGTANATFTVTLAAGFTGTASFTASLSDTVNTAVSQLVNIVVSSAATPPAVPAGLAATAGNAHVGLTWSAATGATAYKVKRSTTSGSGYTTIATPSTNSYNDTTAANGTTYYYVVSATNPAGESANSSEVTATPNYVDVVISQLYGGGGSGTPVYTNDYVELFNRGANTADISGYSIQYGSATGNFASFAGNLFVFPAGTTIGAGKYLTVKTGPAATSGATFAFDLQTPTTDFNMSGTAGKVALTNIATALACGATATPCALPDTRIVDLVAYGSANNGEGGAAVNAGANLDATMGALRNANGCTDTDNNNADFTTATIANGLVPRTSASPANLCGPINHSPSINAPANPIASVVQNAAPFTVTLTGVDDGGTYSWSATAGYGIASVTVFAGQTTASITYSVALQPGFYGTATFTASLSDGINPTVTQPVNIRVNPDPAVDNPPLITPPANPIASASQDSTPFTVNLAGNDDRSVYNWSATPGTGIASVIVTAGAGTANATFTVTLTAGFTGAATFTASLSDGVNTATQVVNITVRSSNHLVISQLYGGGGNSGASYRNDYVELYNPTATTFDLTGWTLQYASSTATSFTNIQPLGGAIAPGQYFFISLASGGAQGADLPAANVYGDLNMSATNGKVALVSNGDGATSCTDPDVVDLVGYGTASCSEGNSNAPAMSNTTALFRKSGGRTDTDNNLNDFIIGAPTPTAPTAPIVEIGPSIVSTDPVKTGTNAPRDANITVNFSEPVDLTPGWFNISCATTGVHNDATVARAGSRSWVIVPNANFLAAETCTATVLKDFIHDSDLDDSAPNTDTLLAEYSWTFTVSTGTAPPYASDVHLTMGNPSGAVADTAVPNNYLMQKPEYAESYNHDRGTPNWVSWHLSDEWIGSLARNDTFRADPAVPSGWYRVLGTDYSGSGFDRGHLTPNADRDKETSIPINQATFLMSNMVPQAPDNNQGPWANFENYLRSLLPPDELYIVAGPAGIGGTGSNGFATTIANGHVTIPASTWKVVLVLPKATGDDVARVTAATRTIAINIPNVQGITTTNANDWQNYLTTVDAVESMTGYDFFSTVPRAVQASMEAGINGVNPPGAASLSVGATEDTAKAIALDGVSPGGGAVTYTIVSQPTHGALSGTGANRTYTPAVDYNGSDSFTYRVNDSTADSNVATVTIAIAEVNDAPTAVDDVKSTSQNTTLVFSAADLIANDLAGPANESGQALTVTAVTATAQTYGTATLNAGQITYVPDATFLGPASFTYRVCDNGLTSGATDVQCATATVNVSVASCPAPVVAAPVTVSATVCPNSPNNTASAPAGAASYSWQSTNGTITAGQGTSSIRFTAGASGTVSFSVLMAIPSGCPTQSTGSTRISGPAARMVPEIHACPGATVSVPVMLSGTAPFEIVWSDGLRQSGITETTVVREFSVKSSTTVTIVAVNDASCATGASVSTEIVMDGPPRFGLLPVDLRTWPGVPVTITVTAAPVTALEWFEGEVGDESKHVGSGATFKTPPLRASTTYWVRADSPCGSTRSGRISVTVLAPRRRPSSH